MKKFSRVKYIVLFGFVFFLMAFTLGSANSSDKPLTSKTFIDVSKKALPSVVSIRVKKTIEPTAELKRNDEQDQNNDQGNDQGDDNLNDFLRKFFNPFPCNKPGMPQEFEYSAAGSGVIIRADGYIITNNHVVTEVKEGNIEVKLNDGKIYDGDKVKIIGSDSLTDLAIIKIAADKLPAAPFGDSDTMEIGEWVIALGNPLELNNSVTQGIISAKGREIHRAPLEDLMQTTAIINPGNSGGPLVNLDAEVVGINMAIASNTGYWQGIGFAIPSNVAKRVADSIIDGGKVKRGYIGILMDELRPDVAKLFNREPSTGIIVTEVTKDAPAEKAGIKAGDLIYEVDGHPVKDPGAMVKSVATKDVGTEVKVKVLRYKDQKIEDLSFTLKLSERPSETELAGIKSKQPAKEEYSTLGLRLEDILNPDGSKGPGVRVKKVQAGSIAASSTLRQGDVIIEVNGATINTVDDFNKAITEKKDDKGFFIQFDRNNTRSFTVLNPKQENTKKEKK